VKCIIIGLLLPLFLLNSSLSELFKLPVLFSHLTEHRQQSPDLGLLDFLHMHYQGDDQNDQDQDRDMSLPFKKTCENTSFQIAFLPKLVPVIDTHDFFPDPQSVITPRDFHIASENPDRLFRPPRA
jgi:hypothetical protein